MQLSIEIKEIDQALQESYQAGERKQDSRAGPCGHYLQVLQMHLIVAPSLGLGKLDQIISKTPFLLYYSMILRDKQFVIQIMITLHQKNTLEMSNYRICRQDVRGRNLLECAFEKTYKPGFVNSKGKEERTQFIPHHQGYLYFSHFLSLSPIYFSIYAFIQHFPEYFRSAILLPYPEGTITQSSGSQSVVPQTSRVNITWKHVINSYSWAPPQTL